MANALTLELRAAAQLSAAGAGDTQDVGALRTAGRFTVTLEPDGDSALSVVVLIETRASSAAPWTLVNRREYAEPGEHKFVLDGLRRYVRARWELGTGATAAFLGIAVEAHVIYCKPEDIGEVVPEQAIRTIARESIVERCIVVSELADGHFNSAYEMPLQKWTSDVVENCAKLVADKLFRKRGTDPEGPDKLVVVDGVKEANAWFKGVAAGKINPPGIVDSTPTTFEGGSVAVTNEPRGW